VSTYSSGPARLMARRCLTAFLLILTCLFAETAFAAGPFAGMGGEWSGQGHISLGGGRQERVRCRAHYAVGADGNQLRQNLRCASDTYNFNLLSDVESRGGAISGSWSETTRNIGGRVSGRARGGRIDVAVSSQAFNATLTLTSHGNRQTVNIRTDSDEMTGASISLARR
jgi:hypothetical protein